MKTKFKYSLLAVVAIIVVLCSFKYSNCEGDGIPSDGQQMELLYFQGHTYICYRFYKYSTWSNRSYGYGGASIVHNPDCKCGK